MQKSQIIRGLPAAVNEKIVMRFIVNCKLMAGIYLVFFAFCINPSLEIVNQSHITRVLCKLGLA